MSETMPRKITDYHCHVHGWWDATRESGCPECIAQMRRELSRVRAELDEALAAVRDLADDECPFPVADGTGTINRSREACVAAKTCGCFYAIHSPIIALAQRQVAEGLKERNKTLTQKLNHAVAELATAAFSEDFDSEDCMRCIEQIQDEFAKMDRTTDWHTLNSWYDRLCAACGVSNEDEIDILPIAEKRLRAVIEAEQRAAALEKDAGRYRWLRDEAGDRMVMHLISSGSDYWDAAIDAARSAEGQGGETI